MICPCEHCTRSRARRDFRQKAKRGLFVALLVLSVVVAICAAGCDCQEARLTTGATLVAYELPIKTSYGDEYYAVVQSSALPALYDNFRDVLGKQGLVKWDARYDCNHFAGLYIALSQAQFTVAAWQSETKAQTLALAEIWYQRDNGAAAPCSSHAIVAAVTERGLLFIEPQTGREIHLTPAEQQSIYLAKW